MDYKRQRTIPNTATQILIYKLDSLTCAKDIASGLDFPFNHWQPRQRITNSMLITSLIYGLMCSCWRKAVGVYQDLLRFWKSSRWKYVSGFLKSFQNGKTQDVHGVQAEHLKKCFGLLSSPVVNLMLCIISCGYVPRSCWKASLNRCKRRKKSKMIN